MFFNKIRKYIKALINSKKYARIILLGYNCEIAYRFYRNYKFVDSSLFAWSLVTFDTLREIIKNREIIGTQGFRHENHMYTCQATGIAFHGKAGAELFTNDIENNNKIMKEDIEDLQNRLKYLKEKFTKYLQDEEKKLFIIKLSEETVNRQNFIEEFSDLYNNLKEMTKADFKILIICEKSFKEKIRLPQKEIIIRSVEKYSPDEDVTNKKLGDIFGWKLIFTEFKPKYKKKQTKKLKFEEVN